MAKAKLSDEVKTYIVQALAYFDALSIVAAAVKKEFGIEVKKAASSWRTTSGAP